MTSPSATPYLANVAAKVKTSQQWNLMVAFQVPFLPSHSIGPWVLGAGPWVLGAGPWVLGVFFTPGAVAAQRGPSTSPTSPQG